MADVVYRSWSLLPRDVDPVEGRPIVVNPPMMSSIALDAGGSLCFEVDSGPGALQVAVNVTGFSSETRGDDFLDVYVGAEEGGWTKVPVRW